MCKQSSDISLRIRKNDTMNIQFFTRHPISFQNQTEPPSLAVQRLLPHLCVHKPSPSSATTIASATELCSLKGQQLNYVLLFLC